MVAGLRSDRSVRCGDRTHQRFGNARLAEVVAAGIAAHGVEEFEAGRDRSRGARDAARVDRKLFGSDVGVRELMHEAGVRAIFEQAADKYQKAVDLAPSGERTPDALLRLGLALRSLQREDRARDVWARLLRDFPDSDAAVRARAAAGVTSQACRLHRSCRTAKRCAARPGPSSRSASKPLARAFHDR